MITMVSNTIYKNIISCSCSKKKKPRDRYGKNRFEPFEELGIPHEFCQEYHDIMGDKQIDYMAVNLVFQGQQFWPHTHRRQTF